jgi:hypothetical protein
MKIDERPVPPATLIAPFAEADAHYVDCFECVAPGLVTLEQFLRAFYTQPLFRAERLVLRVLAAAPSTDADVAELATGQADRFAVWHVAGRTRTEALMRDKSGRTMSWLQADGHILRFGSVVVPVRGRGGKLTLGPVFHSLLGAHKVYSRALLAGAARRVAQAGTSA